MLQDQQRKLNAPSEGERLSALTELIRAERSGDLSAPKSAGFVNNHIHTIYSFSPYSPSAAIWKARAAGLETAGIMDHDSVGGLNEFIAASKITGLPVTCGFEIRVSLAGSPFMNRRVNNPDQNGVAYLAAHGIPRNKIAECESFLAPFRSARNIRNRKMTENLNKLLAPANVVLDFDRDVLPLSQASNGGSVTERHLLYAVSLKLTQALGKGPAITAFLKDKLGISAGAKLESLLADPDNEHYEYDLLGVLKGHLVEKFYIDATDECPPLADFIAFTKKIGAISAYAYLGDVGDSVTGDKKTQKFEDDYLDELFEYINDAGFDAVTYMPSRNTMSQLERVMSLCEKHNLFQISGEDINSPRQSFICPALAKPEFAHLMTATWALIGHELEATRDPAAGMFSPETKARYPKISDRVEAFAELGRALSKDAVK